MYELLCIIITLVFTFILIFIGIMFYFISETMKSLDKFEQYFYILAKNIGNKNKRSK